MTDNLKEQQTILHRINPAPIIENNIKIVSKSKVIGTIESTSISPVVEVRMEKVSDPADILSGDFGGALLSAGKTINADREVVRAVFIKNDTETATVWDSESWKGVNGTNSSQHGKLFEAYEAYTGIDELPDEKYSGKMILDASPISISFSVDDMDTTIGIAIVANLMNSCEKNIPFRGTLDAKDSRGQDKYIIIEGNTGGVVNVSESQDGKARDLDVYDTENMSAGEIAEKIEKLM